MLVGERERDCVGVAFIGRVYGEMQVRRWAEPNVARFTQHLTGLNALSDAHAAAVASNMHVLGKVAVVETQHDRVPLEQQPHVNPTGTAAVLHGMNHAGPSRKYERPHRC